MSRFLRWFDRIQSQTQRLVQVSLRETPARLIAGVMILVILASHDQIGTAARLGGALFLIEGALAVLLSRLAKAGGKISVAAIATLLCLHLLLVGAYLFPTVVLSRDGSTALLVAGLLWMFGLFAFVSNTLSALPFYLHTLVLATFGAALYALSVISDTSYRPSNADDWLLAAVLLMVYAANKIQTVSRQKRSSLALHAAQDEANARLRALEYLSEHDSLTGLLNRRAFDQRLERYLTNRKGKSQIGVFLIDLDGFKPINDSYSHSAGDEVLQEIGRRLKDLTGDYGLVARLGGDEFILAFRDLGSEQAAFRLGRMIRAAVTRPIVYDGKNLQVGASVGISISSRPSDRVSALCSEADQAMYRAKGLPSRKIILYRPKSFPPRPTLDDKNELLAAFQARRILPYYQPKVSLDTGLTIGFEALARWDHPDRGILPPSEFIPRINQLGLQADFLLHMAACALTDIEKLIVEGLNPGDVSINVPEVTLATLSGRHELDRLLARHPGILQHLTLEMTEDVFIARSAELIRESIAHFRRAGLRVSLDDFGTGFASFQHLRQLEFDELKIDPSFVSNLCTNRTTEVLVTGFLNMAKGLGVDAIAEGVETTEQLDRLRDLGCTRVQGYLFGQAMPLNETRIRLFAEQSWAPVRVTRTPSPFAV